MARCADRSCQRWLPDWLVTRGWGGAIDGLWYCSRPCLAGTVRRRFAEMRTDPALRSMPPARLGALLKQRGAVPPEFVEQALAAQQDSRLKLGEQLHAMGVDPEAILAALAVQSGARCLFSVDPQTVRDAPGGFNPDTVRAIGLIPLSRPDGGHIRMAATAPVPRRAMNAVRVLTGLVPEAYVVSDQNFAALASQYGADGVDTSLNAFASFGDMGAMAAHVASLAEQAGTITIEDAWLDGDRRWLRVAGAGRLDDVVLLKQPTDTAAATADGASNRKETSCLAATTSH